MKGPRFCLSGSSSRTQNLGPRVRTVLVFQSQLQDGLDSARTLPSMGPRTTEAGRSQRNNMKNTQVQVIRFISPQKSLVEGKNKRQGGKSQTRKELPGGPVVETPCFHCRGRRFNPRSGKLCRPHGVAKKRKRKKRDILKPTSESTAGLRGLQGKKQ